MLLVSYGHVVFTDAKIKVERTFRKALEMFAGAFEKRSSQKKKFCQNEIGILFYQTLFLEMKLFLRLLQAFL